MRRGVLRTGVALATLLIAVSAFSQDKVRFGTNWRAQGAHGGFYQALVDGTYKKLGLDVEILQGGPQVNNRPLLAAGKLDFLMAGNLLQSFDNVKNGIPTVVVAAFFQRDPQILMVHQGAYPNFAALKSAKTVLISKDGQFSFWQWLKTEHGFRDEQLRPYTFNLGPWLIDKAMVQQGYATSEPVTAAAQGAKPQVFMLADQGWNTYSTTVETRSELIRTKRAIVRRFVEGSIIGWYNFLYGDRRATINAIRKVNPDLSEDTIEGEIQRMQELRIVDSGDAIIKGIGAIDLVRVRTFHESMVKTGLYKPGEVDIAKVATDQFVNKGVGLDVKKRLAR